MWGEEVQIKELKALNEMDGRLLLGLGRVLYIFKRCGDLGWTHRLYL